MVHVDGWKSSQNEVKIQPGEVGRAWALGGSGGLRGQVGTREQWGGLSTGVRGRSPSLRGERPQCSPWVHEGVN